MNVGRICTREVVSIDRGASLAEAARLMRDRHVGALVLTTQASDGVHVSGIVTDRDLVVDVLARGLDPSAVRIGELAGPRLASVPEGESIAAAIELMNESGVRRLLVTDMGQGLAGVVSLDDLLAACAAELDGLAWAMRSGIAREAGKAARPAPAAPRLRVPSMGTAGWGNAPT